jgi:hypothetical protein
MFPGPNLSMSHSELHQCVQYARAQMARHGTEWTFMMPLYVLGHFFGDQWVQQNLFKEGFLKPPSKAVDRSKQLQVGMTGYQLAEALFNLQAVAGFPGIHCHLSAGELEPCIGEPEAAKFLKSRGEQIRSVTPQGSIGNDYDLEIKRDAGEICCEVKIKLEAETLTAKGSFNSLERARKQLPKDKPGLIFLRIVGNTTNTELQGKAHLVQGAVKRLFAQTERVVGVILLTHMYEFSEKNQTLWDLWRTIPNPKSQYPTSLLDGFSNRHIDVTPDSPHWTYLAKYRPRFLQGLL